MNLKDRLLMGDSIITTMVRLIQSMTDIITAKT